MPSIESFKTKRGVVRFTDDAVLVEESVSEYARSLYQGYWQNERWGRKTIFVGYVFGLLFAVGWLASAIHSGDVLLLAGVLGLLVVLLVVNYVRGFRSPDRISLDDIEDVSATRGAKGLTRSRLVVTYTDAGSTYKCRVNLPSLYTDDGDAAFERAVDAFDERGFDIE
ncbi:hypothetical protein GCM10009037_29600 [Halarchaeum grantii]|uniref:Uncharacterized protein n=1 Tax=Halarchaeum grantii TaxID=1193105 RepID=A0A830F5Z8_9EURY|nr:hypothetical protein [Halarchaeum grantii]GGL44288.1 hypothetical protein GCM10009037_29600 [Halarchaeum grantii]